MIFGKTKYIYRLITYGFEGELEDEIIVSDKDHDEFETLLLKISKQSKLIKDKKGEELITNTEHYDNIIKELQKEGCEVVFDKTKDTYILQDECPMPNSIYWTKKTRSFDRLEE